LDLREVQVWGEKKRGNTPNVGVGTMTITMKKNIKPNADLT